MARMTKKKLGRLLREYSRLKDEEKEIKSRLEEIKDTMNEIAETRKTNTLKGMFDDQEWIALREKRKRDTALIAEVRKYAPWIITTSSYYAWKVFYVKKGGN